jgi:hypothetical protein
MANNDHCHHQLPPPTITTGSHCCVQCKKPGATYIDYSTKYGVRETVPFCDDTCHKAYENVHVLGVCRAVLTDINYFVSGTDRDDNVINFRDDMRELLRLLLNQDH